MVEGEHDGVGRIVREVLLAEPSANFDELVLLCNGVFPVDIRRALDEMSEPRAATGEQAQSEAGVGLSVRPELALPASSRLRLAIR